jgi:hypothetical protein
MRVDHTECNVDQSRFAGDERKIPGVEEETTSVGWGFCLFAVGKVPLHRLCKTFSEVHLCGPVQQFSSTTGVNATTGLAVGF